MNLKAKIPQIDIRENNDGRNNEGSSFSLIGWDVNSDFKSILKEFSFPAQSDIITLITPN